MNGSPIAAVIRGWVDLYTRGLPADARAARRDEIDDDLWCEHAEAAAAGPSPRSLDADLALRLMFGIPSDISWRMTFRAERAIVSSPRSTTVDPRIIGAFAIVGGLAWEILMILAIPVGAALWTEGGTLVAVGLLAGLVAFPATAFFLAWLFQDDVSLVGTFGALLVMLGATILLFSAFVVPLAVGSAMLTWRLARIGVVPRLVPVVQATTAILFTVGLSVGLGSEQGITSRALFAILFTPYLLTWWAIGVSLIRGVPQAQARSG
jgi:hypothetical protein